MAQQAPKVAGNLAQRFFNNLKSREFRDYLMRYVATFVALTLCTNYISQSHYRSYVHKS